MSSEIVYNYMNIGFEIGFIHSAKKKQVMQYISLKDIWTQLKNLLWEII